MGILTNIFSKIFPPSHPAVTQAPASTASQQQAQQSPQQSAAAQGGSQQFAGAQAGSGSAAIEQVDVEAILNDMARKSGQTLNWRSSVVDLLKLLDLDSSLQARKDLAHELHYTGDTGDSASMNIWLHKRVMSMLAANGGKVPPELRD